MMHPVYMEVTMDRFELPVAIADSPYELAAMRGVTVYPILHACQRSPSAQHRKKYVKVWVDDREESREEAAL